MQRHRQEHVAVELHRKLGLLDREPLHEHIDADAIQQLREHGGSFELKFEAYGRVIIITDKYVRVQD